MKSRRKKIGNQVKAQHIDPEKNNSPGKRSLRPRFKKRKSTLSLEFNTSENEHTVDHEKKGGTGILL